MPIKIFLCLPSLAAPHEVAGPLLPHESPPSDDLRKYFIPLGEAPTCVREAIRAGHGDKSTLTAGFCGASVSSGIVWFSCPGQKLPESKFLYEMDCVAPLGDIFTQEELMAEVGNIPDATEDPKYAGASLEAELTAIKLHLKKGSEVFGRTLRLDIRVDGTLTVAVRLELPELPLDGVELVLPTAYIFPVFVSSTIQACFFVDDSAIRKPQKWPLQHLLSTSQLIPVQGAEIELSIALKPRPPTDDSQLERFPSLQNTCSWLKAFEELLVDSLELDSSIIRSLQSANVLLLTAAHNVSHYSKSASSIDGPSSPTLGGTALKKESRHYVRVAQVSECLLALGDALIQFFNTYEGIWGPAIARNAAEIIAYGAFLIDGKEDRRREHEIVSLVERPSLSSLAEIGVLMRCVDAVTLLMSHIQVVSDGGIGCGVIDTDPAPKSLMNMLYSQPLLALSERSFDLGPSTTVQRIRLVDCDELVQKRHLQVWEVLDYNDLSRIKYSAISYVWRGIFDGRTLPTPHQVSPGTFVVKGIEQDGDPISIDILISVARASLMQGIHYMWIDRLCILQSNLDDKRWQLEKMRFLYHHCGRCIIVPNGLLSLISPEQSSPWLTRVWTLEEGLVPSDPQVLFSWTHGPGILAQGRHVHGRSLIGYINEIEEGVGIIPLLFLTQEQSGMEASFYDFAGDRKANVVFNLLGGGLAMFASAANNLRPQIDAHETWRSERDQTLWYSALVRDATNRDDIILVLSGLLGFERKVDPALPGKRLYVLNKSQEETLAMTLSLNDPFLEGVDGRTQWNARRVVYDLWYTFKVGTIRPPMSFWPSSKEIYSPPPSHSCLKVPNPSDGFTLVQALSSLLSLFQLEPLGPFSATSTEAYASIRILCLQGIPSKATSIHPILSIEALWSLLKRLPKLCDLELRNWMLNDAPAFDSSSVDPVILHHFKLVDIHFTQTSQEASASLLSLFDTEVLCIHGPPFVEPASSLTTEAEFLNLQHSFVSGVRKIYMHCDTNAMAVWLRALVKGPSSATAENASALDTAQASTLRSVDIICDDMRAAYILGDFLRTSAARSVEHLVIDLSQYCLKHRPIQPEDMVGAVLHHQPHLLTTLTIRMHFVIDASMQQDLTLERSQGRVEALSVLMTSGHMARCLGEALATALRTMKTLNLEIDLVPLDQDDKTQFTVESVLRSVASYQVAMAVGNCVIGWSHWQPSSLEHVNIIWRRSTHSHQGCTIDADDLVTGFLTAIRKYHSTPDNNFPLTNKQFSETSTLVENLVKSGFITSRWDTYERI